MSDPLKVRVDGPLQVLVPPFRKFLVAQGYGPDMVSRHLRFAADLSLWMLACEMGIEDLSPKATEEFLAKRQLTHRHLRSQRALRPFIEFLNSVGVKRHEPIAGPSNSQLVLDRFREYLLGDRALRSATVVNYLNQVRPFLC